MSVIKFLTILSLLIISSVVYAGDAYNYKIKKAQSAIYIDGIITEPDWQSAQVAGNFYKNSPVDTTFAESETEVRMTYNDEFLFVSAICYDPLEGEYIVESLKREFSFKRTDGFAVSFNPFNDKITGFSFGVNAHGAKRDGMISYGGEYGVTTSWNAKYYSQVTVSETVWTVEMAIPFKSLRYNSEQLSWNLNFARNDEKRNETSTWRPVPKEKNVATFAYTGTLIWDNPPPNPGKNINIIPYSNIRTGKDFENADPVNNVFGTGVDAKIGLTSSLNLDITILPDFAQVEADQELINLTQYSRFFPEKREFFLENSDLFSRLGGSSAIPFQTRSIGLVGGEIVPILFGLRLSGKINRDLRIGFMSMETEGVGKLKLNPQNFSMAVIEKKIFNASRVQGFLINRQEYKESSFLNDTYTRIGGLEYLLSLNKNNISGKAYYHTSNYTDINAVLSGLSMEAKNGSFFNNFRYDYAGHTFDRSLGYVPRLSEVEYITSLDSQFIDSTGTIVQAIDADSVIVETTYTNVTHLNSSHKINTSLAYTYNLNHNYIQTVEPYISYMLQLDSSLDKSIELVIAELYLEFLNTSSISIESQYKTINLKYPINILKDKNIIFASGTYQMNKVIFYYNTDTRKNIIFNASGTVGQFYSGLNYTFQSKLKFRIRPTTIVDLSGEWNIIKMPDPWGSQLLDLYRIKYEYSPTTSFSYDLFLQYNVQNDIINHNSRIKYRYSPMSDIYLVYVEKYDTHLRIKHREVVLKSNYWLSM